MMGFFDALAFLTVLPAGRPRGVPRSSSVAFFPLVGLLVGVVWAVVAEAVYAVGFGGIAAVTGAFVLLADAAITGALHLDALGDVADGVASRREPDVALSVMREPAVGAVGAAVVTLVVILRFALLFAALEPALRLVAVPLAGRTAMALLLSQVPVRDDSSLAFVFTRPRLRWLALALLSGAVLAVAVAGTRGLVGIVVALGFAAVYGWWWRRRFGGLTGDGVGAGGLLAETLALVALAAR